jgi:hypothetical protein
MDDEHVLAAMERYGGTFIQRLAACWRVADDVNRETLKAAFPAYWTQYAELVERQRARDRVR